MSALLAVQSGDATPISIAPQWSVGSTINDSPLPGEQPWPTSAPLQPGSFVPGYSVSPPLPAGEIAPSLEPPVNDSLLSSLFGHSEETQSLADFYDPFSRQFAYGSAGVQPYRLGWFSYDDLAWMPPARASVGGNFQNLEWNTSLRYSRVVQDSLVFSWTAALNSKFWTGPTGINFPPDGDQLLSDFQLASNWGGAWNWQLGITPQIDSDFSRTLNSNSLMCDLRAVALYRPTREWTFAIGAAYWNRASDHLIPYGGVIWAPNNRWEFRLLFPKTRISYYAGNYFGFETWGYVSGEYNVEAYQLDLQGPHVSVRGELSDYRFLKGFNFERGRWNLFWEGGAVFDRHVRFRGAVGDFGINEGLMIRAGITY